MTQHDEAVEAALAAQHRLMRSVHAAVEPAWQHLDLTMGQLKTLFALADDAVTVGSLAKTMGVSQPTASQLVDHLVQTGLVERTEDPDDRRRARVRLSPAGAARVAALRQGGEDLWRGLLGRLSDDDLAAWTRVVQTLARLADAEGLASTA